MTRQTTIGRLAAAFVALTVLAGASHAAASPASGCQLTVTPSTVSWDIGGYNPFSSSPLSATYSVTYADTGDAPCDFAVRFQTDGEPFGLTGAGQTLPYVLIDSTDNANATPFSGVTATASQAHFALKPGGQKIVDYAFVVDLSQLPTDGDFSQQLLIEGVSGLEVLSQKQIQLTLGVAPSAVIGLRGVFEAGARGGALVDLGRLQPGPATTLLQLYVQSTSGYRVDVDSANAGRLALQDAPQWTVPYTLVVGDHTLNLTAPGHFDAARLAVARQDLLPVGFVIGDTSDKRAGEYRDVITFSVTAQ